MSTEREHSAARLAAEAAFAAAPPARPARLVPVTVRRSRLPEGPAALSDGGSADDEALPADRPARVFRVAADAPPRAAGPAADEAAAAPPPGPRARKRRRPADHRPGPVVLVMRAADPPPRPVAADASALDELRRALAAVAPALEAVARARSWVFVDARHAPARQRLSRRADQLLRELRHSLADRPGQDL